MPMYVKIADGSDLFLPKYGRVRPGDKVDVPAFVAKACNGSLVPLGQAPASVPSAKLSASSPTASAEEGSFPIAGFDDLNAKEAIKAISALEYEEDLLEVKAYEEAHKNRKTVVAEIEAILAG